MSLPFLHYARLHWPADWPAIYGRRAPLLLELGFGGGDYLVELARDNPSANVLGIEISQPSLRRGEKKLADAGLTNGRVLQGDSRSALWLLFRPATISGVTINFPDPWPKAGHHHRRLISDQFLDLLATRMLPGAALDVATDHEAYALVIAECLARSPYFASRSERPYLTDVPGRRRTKYEQIALSEGRTPRYFLWQRNERDAPDRYPIPEETAVPHVVLQSQLSLDEYGRRFEPFHVQAEAIHIKFLDLYQSQDGNQLLVETYVSEEPYHQRVGLSLRRRKEGDLVLSLQEIGFPRPTRGIHEAIRGLVTWMAANDPELEMVNSTLVAQYDDESFE
jgi:tRNA (guanine-N7-)-methyltransferase